VANFGTVATKKNPLLIVQGPFLGGKKLHKSPYFEEKKVTFRRILDNELLLVARIREESLKLYFTVGPLANCGSFLFWMIAYLTKYIYIYIYIYIKTTLLEIHKFPEFFHFLGGKNNKISQEKKEVNRSCAFN